jgi:1-deoxy-D-xylulose-5-phosphate synthase
MSFDYNQVDNLKNLKSNQLKKIASDLREEIITLCSEVGGHLASNLGVVDLVLALHYYKQEKDKIFFDVGHQCYAHKILTKRLLNRYSFRNTISPFINRNESPEDIWESGHSGTSIAAMMGFLKSQTDSTQRAYTLIGDASLVNGISLESLNLLGKTKEYKGIILLNDNQMSIGKTVGSISNILLSLRGSKWFNKVKRFFTRITPSFLLNFFVHIKSGIKSIFFSKNIFESMGFSYIGVIDGNNIKDVLRALKLADSFLTNKGKSVVIHFQTIKGLGYQPAVTKPDKFHSCPPFEIETGEFNEINTFCDAFSLALSNYQKINKTFFINSAMTYNRGLIDFARRYPDRYIDCGIAEEHASVFAASLAHNQQKVVLYYYSTFAQRSFDQILNDIVRTSTGMLIVIDKIGINYAQGSSHQGLYDLGMFMLMPNVKIFSPRVYSDFTKIINYTFTHQETVIMRFPSSSFEMSSSIEEYYPFVQTYRQIISGDKLAILSYSVEIDRILKIVKSNNLSNIEIVDCWVLLPIDTNYIDKLISSGVPIIIYENAINTVNLSTLIIKYLYEKKATNKVVALAYEGIIEYGNQIVIDTKQGMSDDYILDLIRKMSELEELSHL